MSTHRTPAAAPAAAPVQWPSEVVIILACILGVIAGLIHTFALGGRASEYLQGVIVLGAAVGISPLTGTKFRNALHLPTMVVLAIGIGLTALSIFAPTFSVGAIWVGVIQGIVAFAATLGFGPLPITPGLKYGLIR